MRKNNFRADIQSLRALAVLMVVVYHANNEWLPGGFLGVDIFYTISGFVICRFIRTDIENCQFRFLDFYSRRLTRLFPALFVTIDFTLLISIVIYPPAKIETVVESAIWGMLSLPNFYFYLDSGYFSSEAIQKPLLHLWSLGVEEQFYMFFPLLFFAGAKVNKKIGAILLFLIFSISLRLSIFHSVENPSAAFFMTSHRVFQFVIGVAMALIPYKKIKYDEFCWYFLACLILLFCLFYIDSNTILPGWRGLLLGIVVANMILVGEKVKSNRFVQYIGNSSYSIYLAHWPIAVFVEYLYGEVNPNLTGSLKIVFGLLFGFVLHHTVEQYYRKKSVKYVLTSPVMATISGLLIAVSIFKYSGLYYQNEENMVLGDKENNNILSEGPFIVVGDSHANVLSEAIRDKTDKLQTLIYPGCVPLFGINKIYNIRDGGEKTIECVKQKDKWEQTLSRKAEGVVVIASRWDYYLAEPVEGFPKSRRDPLTLNKIENFDINSWSDNNQQYVSLGIDNVLHLISSKRTILFGQVPLQTRKAVDCAERELRKGELSDFEINKKCKASYAELARKSYGILTDLLDAKSHDYENVVFVNPVDYLCNGEYCSLVLNNQLLYQDSNHLSKFGAEYILNIGFGISNEREMLADVLLE